MRALFAIVLVAGCASDAPPEQPCLEAGAAIGARTAECTGDSLLGEARIEQFEAETTCVVPSLNSPEQERDLYACALLLRHLACELVLDYGDDFDAWLSTSPACRLVVELDVDPTPVTP